MVGTPEQPGLIPRCAAELFKVIDAQHKVTSEWKFKVLFSYLEIYQEKVTLIVCGGLSQSQSTDFYVLF